METNEFLSGLIVDDEPLARSRLHKLCQRIDAFDKVYLAAGGKEALHKIDESRPDIVLLDVDMPDISGLRVAEYCSDLLPRPEIIFTTAHRTYAVNAFRLYATDYLLKPVKESLLREAVDRARDNHSRRGVDDANSADQWLWVSDRSELLQLPVNDIERVEAERDYMRVYARGRSYLMHQSMSSLESTLPNRIFVRIHRSTMVRRDLIAEIRRRGRRRYVVLKDGAHRAVGPLYAGNIFGNETA